MHTNLNEKGVFMKRTMLVVLIAAVFTSTFAQGWASSEGSCYVKGDMNLSAGLSVGYFGAYATFDYAFHDAISGGACIGFNGHDVGFYRVSYIPILVRASFHPFNLTALADKIKIRDKLDVYGGLCMGYTIGWDRWEGVGLDVFSGSRGHFTFRENLGARFYPTPKLFVYAEEFGGYHAFGFLNFGVGLKL